MIRDNKNNVKYELSNHLGNFNETWFSGTENLSRINPDVVLTKSGVRNVITDRKIAEESTTTAGIFDHYTAEVVSYSDYFSFGMLMSGSKLSSERDDNGDIVYVDAHGKSADYSYGVQGQLVDDVTRNFATKSYWLEYEKYE